MNKILIRNIQAVYCLLKRSGTPPVVLKRNDSVASSDNDATTPVYGGFL